MIIRFPIRSLALAAALATCLSSWAQQGPSTAVDPYVISHLPGVEIKSILTVDDGESVPKTGGGTTRLVGIPDGIGAYDGADVGESGFFYLLVNHEINRTQGTVRDHGSIGSFVSKWKIDKSTHEVVEGDDLIKEFYEWNDGTSSYDVVTPGTFSFSRMCSADLPPVTALFNSGTGLGSTEIIYLNGEENSDGRAFAHVVTGDDAGKSYHLSHMGFSAFENVLASPFEQDTTVVILTDDESNGEVYVYVGAKQSTGTEPEKAGLVGGNLYALAVDGKPYERANVIANEIGLVEDFSLKLIGSPGDRPVDESDTETRGMTPETSQSLKMGGPEDGAWDTRPGMENVFYFATKGTGSNGLNAVTRIWKLEFNDISDPSAGGVMTLLQDGPANRLGSLDNMDFEIIDGRAKLYIQEDLGGESRLSKIWEYDIDSGLIEEIAEHDPRFFSPEGSDFLTENEESSGILSLKEILGEGWFAGSVQVHTSSGLSDSGELVEYGQLFLMNIAGRGSDLLREQVVASGNSWDFSVDGTDPGAGWNDVGFVPPSSWNTTTDGTPIGPSPTPIGYGEDPGVLATNVTQPDSPRAPAYYFRKEFDLIDPSAVILFDLYMKVDDGAVVYINGVEVSRYNMALDTVVDNDTFASENEGSERDWKSIPIVCDPLTLQETGNVVAVSLHQENSGSSDIRLDLELFAWNASPDGGDAPVQPIGLALGNATTSQIELTWDAQSDAKFFRIERQQPGDVAWEVVEAEYPGIFTKYVDTDVEDDTTYSYRMSAVNIHGRSLCSDAATGSTEASLLDVIVEEDFEGGDFGIFTPVDVLEPNASWSLVSWDFESTMAAQGNNFGSGNGPTEDWLITTDPINFDFFRNEILEVDVQNSFSGPIPELLYSTDYDPAVDTDPNDATWMLISELDSFEGSLTPFGPLDVSGILTRAYIAFKYTGDGGSGGQSVRHTIDNFLIAGDCGYDFEGGEGSDVGEDPDTAWQVFNLSSDLGWIYEERAGQQSAINNNFGADPGGTSGGTVADDWLVSPAFSSNDPNLLISFEYYENFGDTIEKPLALYATDSFTGDPSTTTWVDITPSGLDGSTSGAYIPVTSLPIGLTGSDLHIAFHYQSGGNGGGTTKRIGVDNICLSTASGPLEVEIGFNRSGPVVSFAPTIAGGTPPYTASWNFGDGNTSEELDPVHIYTDTGSFSVSLEVTDGNGEVANAEILDAILVTRFEVPEKDGKLRISTFNTSMNRNSAGSLAEELEAGDSDQIKDIAEIIQRANPDVLLVNEFDHLYKENGEFDWSGTFDMIRDFKRNYLQVAQAPDTSPVYYRYWYVAPNNTGVQSGMDLDNNGELGDPGDAYGFGFFPGQFAMVFLSKYPIDYWKVRTFQHFRWKDMPGALLPPDPNDTDGDGDLSSYYNRSELRKVRLSSKSHWDIPIRVHGKTIHMLCSHPTPPVFDDGTTGVDENVADWNGLRNHDEIRFWADYIDPKKGRYIYDDWQFWYSGHRKPRRPEGGLKRGDKFVILGDQNADPVDGDATFNPIQMLLDNPLVDTSITPSSTGAVEQVPDSFTDRETKTASFNLRADYALPSESGLELNQAFVLWPESTDFEAVLLGASDHRLVAIDVDLEQKVTYRPWWWRFIQRLETKTSGGPRK